MEASTARLPPGPRLPASLQTLAFAFGARRFLELCRRRYGDVVTVGTAFDSRFVMVFDPELLKQVFQAPPDRLRAGEANALLGPVLGERSLLLLDGAEHLRERRLMLPPFHGQRLRAYEQTMKEAADRAIDGWPVGEPFALMPSMQALTLDVIMHAVWGLEEGPRAEQLKRGVRAAIEPLSRRLGILVLALSGGRFGDRKAVRRFEERRAALDRMIFEEIAARRGAPDLDSREDVFSMLLRARDEAGEPMTDRELRDELVTLLVAGHETTATGLAWAFELLLRTPRVMAVLLQSLAAGEDAYLDAVVKEALRLRPVIPGVGRVVRGEPFELGGYSVPPGMEINPSISMIHRREDRYPAAGEFRPERFLGPDAPDTYTWVPFGGGTRRCIGASFALLEMKVVIRRVLERAGLERVGSRPERVSRRGITLVPGTGVRVHQRDSPRKVP
ncbi:MAG: cytochrome family [Thermoleophilaceae bacterium]|jgi:cytochrome P450|nr:cytochrome family [Thermoleophilaceae bacterium]